MRAKNLILERKCGVNVNEFWNVDNKFSLFYRIDESVCGENLASLKIINEKETATRAWQRVIEMIKAIQLVIF